MSLEDLDQAVKVAKATKSQHISFEAMRGTDEVMSQGALDFVFKKQEAIVQIAFDPAYLKSICELALASDNKHKRITFQIAGETKLATFQIPLNEGQIEGVLAPIQIRSNQKNSA